jgi:hypothetical protein
LRSHQTISSSYEIFKEALIDPPRRHFAVLAHGRRKGLNLRPLGRLTINQASELT